MTGKSIVLIHRPIKISIRLSILSIVLTLLIGISAIIISINYFALDSILIAATNNSLGYASGKVSEQISRHLKPLNSQTSTALNLLYSGVVKPEYSDKFISFLYGIIAGEKDISGAFWGDTAGNMYWLNKNSNGNFWEQISLYGNKTIKKVFDARGKLLSEEDLPFNGVDPRLRPWYQDAQSKEQTTWVIYRFLPAGTQQPTLGITAASPLYDSDGKFLGVLGIDMLVENISKYVSDIKFTKNTVIFVDDGADHIMSVGVNGVSHLFEGDALPELTDLKMPWLEKSFALYKQGQQSPFIYSDDNKKYVSYYEKVVEARGEHQEFSQHPWVVAVVTPMDDIIAPLRRSILMALVFVSIVLVFGVVLASVFSSNLSRPIIRLAQDANLICQLRLTEIREIFSRIREIAEMEESFMKMKNALKSFQCYMPVALVKKLIISNQVAAVGGDTKELTIIFTDIQNFTQLSEHINPQELMQYLSRYFQTITKVIIEMNGTVDKYIGDGVMAFWGAPTDDSEHALHACQAMLQVQVALKQLNEELRMENKPLAATRIGINTGSVVVGNVGSDERLNYTSLGDPVNLASRLENLNKVYGTGIIVSEFTYNKVKNNFKFRLLDKVAAKGKKQGIYIYELLGDVAAESDLELEQYNREFFDAFSQYENGDWQTAVNLFSNLEKKHPEDLVIKIFIKRCLVFSDNPPVNWDGVWVMTEK